MRKHSHTKIQLLTILLSFSGTILYGYPDKVANELAYLNRINTLYLFMMITVAILFVISIIVINRLRRNYKRFKEKSTLDKEVLRKPIVKQKKEEKPQIKPNSKTRKELFTKARQLVAAQQLFLNPELRKPDLAKLLKTNATYLANSIQANTGMSYNDWINSFRIDYLLERLQNTSQLEVLSKEAGFSSLSVFYNSFKKRLGCKPGEYLQKQTNQKQKGRQSPKDHRPA